MSEKTQQTTLEEEENIWKSSGEGFEQTVLDVIKYKDIELYRELNEKLKNHKDKTNIGEYLYGLSIRGETKFIWRKKTGGNSGGGGYKKDFIPKKVLGVMSGSPTDINTFLKEHKDENWVVYKNCPVTVGLDGVPIWNLIREEKVTNTT